jgi:hypothetical protein
MLIPFLAGHAAIGRWQWATDVGGAGNDYLQSLALDSSGNLIVGGTMSGPLYIGTNRFNGAYYGVLAKYESNGQLAWARQLPGDEAGVVAMDTSVATDLAGNSYSLVHAYGSGHNVFLVAKHSASGTPTFSRRLDIPYLSRLLPGASPLAVDGNGNLFAASDYVGRQVVGPGLEVSSDINTISITKLGPDGNPIWVTNAALPASGMGVHLATICSDGTGGIWLAGNGNQTFSVGTNTLSVTPKSVVFLAHYNPNGQALWSGMISPPDAAATETILAAAELAVASNGDVIVACTNGLSWLLARYDASGKALWWTAVGSPFSLSIGGLAIDGHENIHVVGQLNYTSTFGGQTVVRRSIADIFLAEYDAGGNFQNVVRAGSPEAVDREGNPVFFVQQEFASSLAVDAAGNAFLAGSYSSKANFDDFQLVSQKNYGSSFIARFDVTPWLLSQPGAQVKLTGQTAYFRVRADGVPPFHYQWMKNGVPLEGKTNALLAVPDISTNSAGAYSVQVGNRYSSTVSEQAPLEVNTEGVEIELHPSSNELYAGVKIIGVVGRHYLIQSSAVTAPASWTTLTNISLTASPQLWLDPTPATGTQRFYHAVPQQ